MLRASVELKGGEVDLRALTDATAAGHSGIAHGAELIAFAEAVLTRDEQLIAGPREVVRSTLGDAALIDAAGIIANFQRMVRIADSTGIPLDAAAEMLSADVREGLGVEEFASASNTPDPGILQRVGGHVLRPLISTGLKLFGATRNKRSSS